MSIAEDFADTYIEYLRATYDNFTPWLMSIMDVDTLHNIVVMLYWAISNEWDRRNHSPVPDKFWLPFMEYNLRTILRYITSNLEEFGTDDYIESVYLALQRGFQMCVDIEDVGPSAGFPY